MLYYMCEISKTERETPYKELFFFLEYFDM